MRLAVNKGGGNHFLKHEHCEASEIAFSPQIVIETLVEVLVEVIDCRGSQPFLLVERIINRLVQTDVVFDIFVELDWAQLLGDLLWVVCRAIISIILMSHILY